MMKLIFGLAASLILTACGSGESVQVVESCFIDAPVNNSKLPTGQDFKVSGWAYDKQASSSPEQVSVLLNGKESKTFVATRVKRPDVVKAFNTPGAEMSGYEVIVPANSLAAGQYQVVIVQTSPDRKLKCLKDYMLTVTGERISVPAPVVLPVPVSAPDVATVKAVVESAKVEKAPEQAVEINKVPEKKPQARKKKTKAPVESSTK